MTARDADSGERLDKFIARAGGVTRGEARRALDLGGVWLDGRRVKRASLPVQAGQRVTVVLEEAGRSEPGPSTLAPERILFEDDHLIAVDKPPFVVAQPTLATDQGTLLAQVSAHLGRPAGLVHRLDRETSGVTVFAKTAHATSALAAAFREGTARKRYLAVTVGVPPASGRIDLPLSPDPRRRGRFLAVAGHGVPAVTLFRTVSCNHGLCALELSPETGRTHQLRVHLSALGAPILGDVLYGGPLEAPGPEPYRTDRFLLHARSLHLPHPASGATLELQAPIPDDLARALTLAGADPSSL